MSLVILHLDEQLLLFFRDAQEQRGWEHAPNCWAIPSPTGMAGLGSGHLGACQMEADVETCRFAAQPRVTRELNVLWVSEAAESGSIYESNGLGCLTPSHNT